MRSQHTLGNAPHRAWRARWPGLGTAWQRAAWLVLLGWAILLAAQLGQWHRYAHAPQTVATVASGHLVADSDLRHHAHVAERRNGHGGWLAHLFGGHADLDCRVLDQLVHGSAPGADALPPLPPVVPEAWMALWHAPTPTERAHRAYQARAPPLPHT